MANERGDVCNHTVKLGGKLHAPGDAIVVKDEKERGRLLAIGAIREANDPAPSAVVEVRIGEIEPVAETKKPKK